MKDIKFYYLNIYFKFLYSIYLISLSKIKFKIKKIFLLIIFIDKYKNNIIIYLLSKR